MSTLKFPWSPSRAGLVGWALLELLILAALTLASPRSAPWTFIGGFALAFLAYLGALRTGSRLPPEKLGLSYVVAFAILFRLVALGMAPQLSDDLFRYLWEGRVGSSGLSPYLYAPASPALDAFADPIRERVNHPEIPSIYPPAAQWLFQAMAMAAYTPLTPKVVFTLFDLLTLAGLALLCRQRSLPPSSLLIYAWNPLPVLEFGGNGHLDSAAIAFLVLALVPGLETRARRLLTAILLTASILIKVFAAALLPWFVIRVWRMAGPRALVTPLLVSAMLVGAAYLPYLSDGRALLEGMSQYGHRWSFNGSLFPLARTLLGEEKARLLMILAFGAVALYAAARQLHPPHAAFLVAGAFFLLSPTAHPWYLCWTLPFLVFRPSPAWILLSGTVVLSYSVFAGAGGWEEIPWVPWLEYTPFAVLLVTTALPRPQKAGDSPVDNSYRLF